MKEITSSRSVSQPSPLLLSRLCLGLIIPLGGSAYAEEATANEAAATAKVEQPAPEETALPATEWAAPERYYDLFSPLSTERASLSPDGEKVAFTYYDSGLLSLMIVQAKSPFELLASIRVGDDESATPLYVGQGKENVPLQIVWLGWVTDQRLVFQTNQVLSYGAGLETGNTGYRGYLYAVNGDGSGIMELGNPLTLARLSDTASPVVPEVENRPLSEEASDLYAPHFQAAAPVQMSKLGPVQILDFDPKRDGNIIVRSGFETDFDLYSINAMTGRKEIVANEHVGGAMKVLLDRQYEANIALPNTMLSDFPHRYKYDEPRLFSLLRWKNLDDFIEAEDGLALNFSLSPENFVGDRSVPLGFDENRELLYYASDVGRETFGIYCANLKTGERTDFALEHPRYDLIPPTLHDFAGNRNLVYDRFTRALAGIRFEAEYRSAAWINQAWQSHQVKLEQAFPNSSVDILEWDRNYTRMLVRVNSPTDPGNYYLYNTRSGDLVSLVPRSEHFDNHQAWTVSMRLSGANGRSIPVRLTIPTETIHKPTPLIVLFADDIWDRLPVDFDREVLAFARMGYVIAQFGGRGAWGYGKSTREALHTDGEEGVATEMVTLVNTLKARFAIHPRSIALIGEGMGGYQALQTLRQNNNRFRCAIAINTPLNPDRWIDEARWADVTAEEAGEIQLFGGSAYDNDLTNLDEARWTGSSELGIGFSARSTPGTNRFGELYDRPTAPLRLPEAADLQLIKPYLQVEREKGTLSLVDAAEEFSKPILFFAFREEDGDSLDPDFNEPFTVARNLRGRGIDSKVIDLHRDYARGLPQARADVFAEIAAFLNTHMFDYSVDPGEMEFVPLSLADTGSN